MSLDQVQLSSRKEPDGTRRVSLSFGVITATIVGGISVPFLLPDNFLKNWVAPLFQQLPDVGQLLNKSDASILGVITVVIGTVLWLLRDNRKQAVEVNSQFLNHMQSALSKEQSVHETYAAHIGKLATAVEANTAALAPMIKSMQEMSESVKIMTESIRQMVQDHHKDVDALVKDYAKLHREREDQER